MFLLWTVVIRCDQFEIKVNCYQKLMISTGPFNTSLLHIYYVVMVYID
jgi:hypothetical protein